MTTSRSRRPLSLQEQLAQIPLHIVYKEPVNMSTSNAKGTRDITRAVLTLKESIALNKFVVEHYTKSGLDNPDFATAINANPDERAKYRFDLNRSHITSACEAADIPNNRGIKPITGDIALTLRVQELEEQMARVLKRLEIKP